VIVGVTGAKSLLSLKFVVGGVSDGVTLNQTAGTETARQLLKPTNSQLNELLTANELAQLTASTAGIPQSNSKSNITPQLLCK
jgi:hypothetical protein